MPDGTRICIKSITELVDLEVELDANQGSGLSHDSKLLLVHLLTRTGHTLSMPDQLEGGTSFEHLKGLDHLASID
jgi:hypothetical protein